MGSDCDRQPERSDLNDVSIRRATARDVPRVAEIMAIAFSADHVMRSMLLDAADPEPIFREYFRVQLEDFYVPQGRVDVAEIGGTIMGAAAWQRYDAHLTGYSRLRFDGHMALALGASLPRMLHCDNYGEKLHPKFAHWYLPFIAVARAARGHGVGGALLDAGIEVAGDSACYLEATTSASRALYERKGFIALGRIDDGVSVPYVGMWRPGVVAS